MNEPGQYVFINVPELAKFQWHPFTLTSAPGDDYLSVHVRAAGDWTKVRIVQLALSACLVTPIMTSILTSISGQACIPAE